MDCEGCHDVVSNRSMRLPVASKAIRWWVQSIFAGRPLTRFAQSRTSNAEFLRQSGDNRQALRQSFFCSFSSHYGFRFVTRDFFSVFWWTSDTKNCGLFQKLTTFDSVRVFSPAAELWRGRVLPHHENIRAKTTIDLWIHATLTPLILNSILWDSVAVVNT